MAEYTTWITIEDGKVDRIRQIPGTTSPDPEWKQVSNNWGGNPKDDLSWFDETMHKISDDELVKQGKRKNNIGRWYHKKNIGESKQIYGLDEEAGEDWTKETPLENELYQKFDGKKKKWIIDTEKKETAEKEQHIAEKKSAINIAEQQIVRSLIAKVNGKVAKEDEQFFIKFNNEINILRAELQEIQE